MWDFTWLRESHGLGLYGPGNIKIPLDLVISRSFVLKNSHAYTNLSKCLDEVGEDERLAIVTFLLTIKLTDCPRFRSYCANLPKSVDSPVLWDTESLEFQLLNGTSIQDSVTSKAQKLKREYARLAPLYAPCFTSTIADFVWADFIFWSRAISFKSAGIATADDYHLVPVIDFCNHSFSPNAFWKVDNGFVELVVDSNKPDEDEIVISYGPRSNAEFLFLYGFACLENPSNPFSIMPPIVECEFDDSEFESGEMQATVRRKQALFVDLGLNRNIAINVPTLTVLGPNSTTAWNPTNGIINDHDLITLYICVVTVQEGLALRQGEPLFGKDFEPFNSNRFRELLEEHPLRLVFSLRIWTILSQIIEYHLSILLQEPEESLVETNAQKYALIVRRGQAQTLGACLGVIGELIERFSETKEVQTYLQ
jgi:hypothetical protein